MAVAFDSTAGHSASATGTSTPISVTVTIASGEMVLVFSGTNTTGASATVSSISDTGGNLYQKLASVSNTSRVQMDCWVCYNTTATATSITVNYSGTPTHGEVSVVQYTGAIIIGQITTGTLASSTSLTASDITQGQNSWFIVGFGNQGLGTHAAGAGNLRTSGTSAGTATTAIGMAAMDNTIGAQSISLSVTETLGTAGIGAFILVELMPQMVLVGDDLDHFQFIDEAEGLYLRGENYQEDDWEWSTAYLPPFVTKSNIDTDAEAQFLQVLSYPYRGDGDVSDSGVELIQYGPGVLRAWDTDADQQKLQPPSWQNQQEEDQDHTILITLPPFIDTVEQIGGSEDE